jgi:hypothetical protein
MEVGMMTPKARTISDYLSGEFTDVNTGAIVNPDLLQRSHIYVIPDDVRGGKMFKRNIKNRERYRLIQAAFYAAMGCIIGYGLHKH